MSEALTPLERRVYHYLLDFLAENTYQPSIRDICKRFKIKSTKSAADILQSLAEKGYIERDGARSRGVRLIGFQSIGGSQPVPLYSRVNSGQRLLVPENRERHIVMDRIFVPTDDAFFVRVEDGGMADRGIHAGDLALVNPAARARENDAVAARVGDRCVIRLLAHRGASLALIPAASDEREITLGPDEDFEILGVVATVVRTLQEILLPQPDEMLSATAVADLQET